MYILFEEHQYESSTVEKILKDIYVLQDVDKKVSVQYVGYFYNPQLRDCVFILPKVLLRDDPQKKQEVLPVQPPVFILQMKCLPAFLQKALNGILLLFT